MAYIVEESFSDADWTWVGRDKNGLLATFTTAGQGPAPYSLIYGAERKQIFNIEDEVLKLPEITSSSLNPEVDYPNVESYLKLSRRGLFSFDWSDVHRKETAKTKVYQLISKPTDPLRFSSLSEGEVGLLLVISLPEANFSLSDVACIKV